MTTGEGSGAAKLAEPRSAIDGKLVGDTTGRAFTNVNPATEEVLGHTYDAGEADMDRAIAAARRTFDETAWSTDHAFRKRCLLQLQEALERHKELLRQVVVAEAGSPVSLTSHLQLETPLSENLRWPAGQIDTFAWERPLEDSHLFGARSWRVVRKEPVGVVGLIIPWNFPVETSLNKLGFALATGNTVVLTDHPHQHRTGKESPMRVEVDVPKCVASGQCVLIAPEVFDQRDEDGMVVLLDERPPSDQHDAVQESATVCPAAAIRLVQE